MLTKIIILIITFGFSNAFAGDFFEETSTLYQNNQFNTVEQKCLNELKVNDKSLDALFFLAAIRLNEGSLNEAEPYMEKFANLHKQLEEEQTQEQGAPVFHIDARYAVLYYELGRYFFETKKYREATEWFQHAKSFYFDDPMFCFFIGISYKEIENYSESLKYFQRQLEQNPDEPSPLYNIACVYAVQGQKDEAITWLKKSIKAYPQFKEQASKDIDFDLIRNSKEFKILMD